MSLIFHTSVAIFAQATLATRAGTVFAHSYMPPKGSKKTLAKLGSVVPHGNGFRVQANIERHGSSVQRRTQTAPYRTTLAKANEDLRRVQSARTLEEYGHILEQLWQEAEACRSGDGSGVVTSSGPAAAIADGQEEAARQDEAKWVPQVIIESHTMAPKQKPLHELGALAPHGVKWLPASMADSVRRQSKWRRANGGQKPMHTSCMAKPVESGGGTGVPHSAAGAKPGMALKKPVSELGTVVADVADGNQRAKRKRDMAYDESQVGPLKYVLRRAMGTPPWPLLLFLHGAGERGHADGRDLQKVLVHGPWRAPGLEQCVVLAPQCHSGLTWSGLAHEVVAVVKQVVSVYHIAKNQCYVTGLSMGAFGVWAVAAAAPDLFAAAVPICGGFSLPMPSSTDLAVVLHLAKCLPNDNDLACVRKLPAWLFHGERDKIVDVQGSRNIYTALGGAARDGVLRLQIYPGMGHSIWGRAYNTADLFQWLLSHKRGESGPKESDGNQRAERKSPLKPMMTEREVEAEIASDCQNSGTLTELRGINIQQPWARLILDGCKTIEARKYPLRGYLNELLWVIETSGTCKRTIDMDRPTGLQPEQLLGRRHRRVRAPAFSSKIIGVVRFGSDHEYTDVQQWRSDEKRHCITECSQFDWNGAESEVPKMYGWHVESAHYLTEPQRAPVKKGMIGCKAIKRYVHELAQNGGVSSDGRR